MRTTWMNFPENYVGKASFQSEHTLYSSIETSILEMTKFTTEDRLVRLSGDRWEAEVEMCLCVMHHIPLWMELFKTLIADDGK